MPPDPQKLRTELQSGGSDNLRHRRTVIDLSLLGMITLCVVSLFQTGGLKHLTAPAAMFP